MLGHHPIAQRLFTQSDKDSAVLRKVVSVCHIHVSHKFNDALADARLGLKWKRRNGSVRPKRSRMLSFHQSSWHSTQRKKSRRIPRGINASNESPSPYYDKAQLHVSHSASDKIMQRLIKEQLVCALHRGSSVDVRRVTPEKWIEIVCAARLSRKEKAMKRQGEGLLINIP